LRVYLCFHLVWFGSEDSSSSGDLFSYYLYALVWNYHFFTAFLSSWSVQLLDALILAMRGNHVHELKCWIHCFLAKKRLETDMVDKIRLPPLHVKVIRLVVGKDHSFPYDLGSAAGIFGTMNPATCPWHITCKFQATNLNRSRSSMRDQRLPIQQSCILQGSWKLLFGIYFRSIISFVICAISYHYYNLDRTQKSPRKRRIKGRPFLCN